MVPVLETSTLAFIQSFQTPRFWQSLTPHASTSLPLIQEIPSKENLLIQGNEQKNRFSKIK
jgi:hypothetical protein